MAASALAAHPPPQRGPSQLCEGHHQAGCLGPNSHNTRDRQGRHAAPPHAYGASRAVSTPPYGVQQPAPCRRQARCLRGNFASREKGLDAKETRRAVAAAARARCSAANPAFPSASTSSPAARGGCSPQPHPCSATPTKATTKRANSSAATHAALPTRRAARSRRPVGRPQICTPSTEQRQRGPHLGRSLLPPRRRH